MKDKYDITQIGKQINVSEQLKQELEKENKAEVDKNEILAVFQTINFPLMLGAFLFYFLGGYLLYSALFAAIGAAVDNETDTQQFMMPVTLPLVLGFIVSQAVMQNPESPIAFWFSMIPFTSPVVMMVRLAFEVPMWQLLLSASLLITGFFASTWLAAKIYRIGILMYGKKVTYKELWRWLKFKG
jgi:ABC-2 type transport system permease protein